MQTTTPSRRPTGTRVLPSTGGRLAPWSPFLGGLGLVLLLTPMGLLRTGQAQGPAGWTDLRGRSSYSLEEFAHALFPAAAPLGKTRGIGPRKRPWACPSRGFL